MSPRHNPRSDRERQRDSRQVREDAGGRHLSTWLEPAAAAALAQARARGETIAGFVNRAMVEAGRIARPEPILRRLWVHVDRNKPVRLRLSHDEWRELRQDPDSLRALEIDGATGWKFRGVPVDIG